MKLYTFMQLFEFTFFLQVTELKIKYFDTIPVSNAMCILKTGFLFTASEFGNQFVFCICFDDYFFGSSPFIEGSISYGETELEKVNIFIHYFISNV